MYMYVCIRMHMRESITISRKGEHNSYRRIDWRRLGARSVVMVGNGMSGTAKRSILSREEEHSKP